MTAVADTDTSTLKSDEELSDLLRARGQRVTSQRLVILRELRRRHHHATAEEILGAVSYDLPGITMPTVYSTLELLVEFGLVRKIDVGSGVSLFDGRTDPHQHTVCRVCGRVEDLDGPFDPAALIAAAERGGFRTDQVDVVLSGVCEQCAAAGR
jgi:Fe2+ or Zn2+ uptake regulation protein